MRDRSKTLTVINTGARKKSSETSVVTQYVGGGGGSSASGVFLEKAIWDKVWEIRSTEAGEEYIFGKLPVALQYGLTSFVDGGSLDLQDIYDGLTIDNQTIYWEETEVESTDEEGNIVTEVIKVLKARGGEGGGEILIDGVEVQGDGNAITDASFDSETKILTFVKDLTFVDTEYLEENYYNKEHLDDSFYTAEHIDDNFYTSEHIDDNFYTSEHIDENFYTKTYINEELKKYVPIEGDCEIKGTKNFTGALQVNGQPIVYDVDGGYWKLDGDLLVTGGITSFADDTAFTPSTIMDALVLDSSTLEIDENGQLTVIGGTGGGGEGVDEDAVRELIESYNYLTASTLTAALPTATTSVKGIASFSSTDFTVSSGKVSLAARVKIVQDSLPSASSRTTNTLYVIV